MVICCWNKNALCDTPQWCVCFLACLPTLMNFISLALPFLCIYLQQINLLLSTDQTRKRKLTCEMNTNIVSSCDPELSFVLTYIHNLYARAYYMFEVYLDFAHIYAHWNFYHVRILLQFDFPPTSMCKQSRGDDDEREKKISLKCKLESIGLRFITGIIAICF